MSRHNLHPDTRAFGGICLGILAGALIWIAAYLATLAIRGLLRSA